MGGSSNSAKWALNGYLCTWMLASCGCVRPAQFYARDMSSGWLVGPFEPRDGTIVHTTRGMGFMITAPKPGEIDIMSRLNSVRVDISAENEPLPTFVDRLMAAQRRAVRSERVVPISVARSEVWKEYREMPVVNFTASQCSLFMVLRTIQLQEKTPFVFDVGNAGVVIWPVHIASEQTAAPSGQ